MLVRWLAGLLSKSSKSVLLLGPRQTGKSTLIASLNPDLTINLAEERTFLQFSRNPSELQERLADVRCKTVFIDEIQRLPSLLNTVQAIIDDKPVRPARFYLTGSSARKLRRGQANLLPGRVHHYELGGLYCGELGYAMDTATALATGSLPGIYMEPQMKERSKTLQSYAATYLREEIQAEALTRNLEGFSRFIFTAAELSGHLLDFSKLCSLAQIARQSATRYFEILEDTLIVSRCPSFAKSRLKRLIQHPKYYFFDTGVLNALLGSLEVSVDRKGLLFEHLFFNQLRFGGFCRDEDRRISTYRTEHGAEVDFIVEIGKTVAAIELKASANVGRTDLRGLGNFAAFYGKAVQRYVAYLGKTRRVVDGVRILPWQEVLKELDGYSGRS